MKNFKFIQLWAIMAVGIFAVFFASCADDDQGGINTNPPTIISVSEAVQDSLVTTGFADNTYIIRGTGFSALQKIYFNDTDTYFNPTLVTDNVIFVTIDRDTPYADVSNELRIVTKYGTAVYGFVVAPPAPRVDSFNPINANDGEVITIYGSFFLDPEVTIGTTPATVISNTLTQIQVTVPPGSNHKYVTVTTISGSSTSKQAIGTALFDDALSPLVTNVSAWAGLPIDFENSDATQGVKSIKYAFPGYSGLQFDINNAITAGYSGIRVALKGTSEGRVQMILNGNFNPSEQLNIISFTTQWKTFFIPFSAFQVNNLTAVNQIVFQEWGAPGGNTIFIDDIGFTLE